MKNTSSHLPLPTVSVRIVGSRIVRHLLIKFLLDTTGITLSGLILKSDQLRLWISFLVYPYISCQLALLEESTLQSFPLALGSHVCNNEAVPSQCREAVTQTGGPPLIPELHTLSSNVSWEILWNKKKQYNNKKWPFLLPIGKHIIGLFLNSNIESQPKFWQNSTSFGGATEYPSHC